MARISSEENSCVAVSFRQLADQRLGTRSAWKLSVSAAAATTLASRPNCVLRRRLSLNNDDPRIVTSSKITGRSPMSAGSRKSSAWSAYMDTAGKAMPICCIICNNRGPFRASAMMLVGFSSCRRSAACFKIAS